MSSLKIYTFLLLPVIVILQSCVATKTSPESNLKLPDSFTEESDTSNIVTLKYEELFSDSQLVSLIKTGLQNNQDLLIASQRIEIARANFHISKGALLPSLFFETSAGVKRFADYTVDGVGNFDTNLSTELPTDKHIPNPTPDYFIGFRSSWEADVWGKLRNQKKASYARFLATEKGKHLLITNLIAEIGSTYYTLLALDAEREIILKNSKLQEAAVATTIHLKEGGMVNDLAVIQFTAQLLNTQSLQIQIEQEIIKTENRLNVLLGRLPQTIVRGSSLQDQKLPLQVHVGIPSELLINRPDVQMAELEMAASKADVKAARAAFFPSFTINSYAGMNAFSTAVLFSHPGSLAYGLLGGLSAPIFNRNAIKSHYRFSQAAYKEAYYSYQKAVINGYTEVSTTLKQIENLEKIHSKKEEEVSVLGKGVVTSKDLFLVGYASYLEVINAQRSVLNAELDLTINKRDQLLAMISLYRALGGGWE